jgi:hypothetical protein
MENLLRVNSVISEQGFSHLISATNSAFKSDLEVATMSSKERSLASSLLFLGSSTLVPSSSPTSGMFANQQKLT